MAEEAVLAISTDHPERRKVSVDGKLYELAEIEQLGLRELAQLQKIGKLVQKVTAKLDEATDEEIEEAEKSLDEFVRKVLRDIEAEVLAKLTYGQKSDIMKAFTPGAKG